MIVIRDDVRKVLLQSSSLYLKGEFLSLILVSVITQIMRKFSCPTISPKLQLHIPSRCSESPAAKSYRTYPWYRIPQAMCCYTISCPPGLITTPPTNPLSSPAHYREYNCNGIDLVLLGLTIFRSDRTHPIHTLTSFLFTTACALR